MTRTPRTPRTERTGNSVIRLVAGAALSAVFRALLDWLAGR
ncbi:hypothetical protein GCM10010252_53670 [Streptomyces aureoverticillatus]|nr:hypothetical protein GCM10010252_53670 [Streptomyces aureoverticillatus]